MVFGVSKQVVWTTLSKLRSSPSLCVAQASTVAILPWTKKIQARRAAELMLARAGAELLVLAVQDDLAAGPMAVWNCAIHCTSGSFVIYCAQDAFAGRYWLRLALQAMQQPQAGLLAFNDGKWFGQLAAFGLVRRQWLEPIYNGHLFNPDYAQHFGDTELTLIARQQKALVYSPHALLIEVDHHKDQRLVNEEDRALFRQRAASGFDNHVYDPALLASFIV